MAKIDEWKGNEQSESFLSDYTSSYNHMLIDFCNVHKTVYIYGSGKIGTGFMNYLEQCDVQVEDFITSDMLDDFRKIYKNNEVGIIMGLSDKNLGEVEPLVNEFVCKEDLFIADSAYREALGRYTIEHFQDNLVLVIYLLPHCNLNCKGCFGFSPVARPDYYEFEKIKKDIEQIKKLELKIESIRLTGGEPYLRSDLFDIFEYLRNEFPGKDITCLTNGTILNRFDDEQIKKLVELDISQKITVYPAWSDSSELFFTRADKLGMKYIKIGQDDTKVFTLTKFSLDKTALKHEYYGCPMSKSMLLYLFKGKLYKCLRAAAMPYLNEHFDINIALTDKDFMDIYNTTAEDIYEFKIRRTPLCGYHNKKNFIPVEWGISERKIEEWVHFE